MVLQPLPTLQPWRPALLALPEAEMKADQSETVSLHERLAALEVEAGQMREALTKIVRIAYPPLEGGVLEEMPEGWKPSRKELEAEREAMANDLDEITGLCWDALPDDGAVRPT